MKNNDHFLMRNRHFLALWTGETISEFGGAIGALCNPLLLYELTGSKAAMGTLYLTYFIPSLVLQLGIGPLIDQTSRKKIMILSQWIRAFVFFLPVIFTFFQTVPVWSLYLIQLVLGLLQPLYVPAGLAVLPTLVEKQDLTKANAYMDASVKLMSFLAPALGGIIYAAIGFNWTYLIIGSLFFLSSVSLMGMRVERTSVEGSKESWFNQVVGGYKTFLAHPQLLWLGIFKAVLQFGVGVTMVINVPYVLDELKGSSLSYGLFMAGFPLGYMAGSFVVGQLRKMNQKRFIMLGGLVMGGLSFVLLGLAKILLLAIVIEALAGFFLPFFNAPSTSLYQKHVPNHMIGKVFSVRLLIIRATMPLGALFAGKFGDIIGIRGLYFMIGAFICIFAMIGILLPYFRFLDEEQMQKTASL